MAQGGMTVIYDGQCPFCSSYVAMLRLREAVGAVELVDARSGDERVIRAAERGHDLDSGMVVLWDGRSFHGQAAVHLLATLSAPAGRCNRLQRAVFRSPARAALIYPLLARGRRVYLRLAGRGPIGRPGESPAARE